MGPRQASALRRLPAWMTAPRVQARRALFSAGALGKGCPIGAALATVGEPVRKAQLLADTFLGTPQPTLRRRLLACAPAASAEAADLAVAALWDDDEVLHEYGRAAVAAHPAAALAQGRAVLPFFDETAPSAESDGRPSERYGLLQLMSALPAPDRPA